MPRPGVKPATSRSWVQHASHYTTEPPKAWNQLPVHLWALETVGPSKLALKTYLYSTQWLLQIVWICRALVMTLFMLRRVRNRRCYYYEAAHEKHRLRINDTNLIFWQRLVFGFLQNLHSPHCGTYNGITWSPKHLQHRATIHHHLKDFCHQVDLQQLHCCTEPTN